MVICQKNDKNGYPAARTKILYRTGNDGVINGTNVQR